MRIKRVLGHTKRAVKRVVSVLSPLSLKSYGGSQIVAVAVVIMS